MITQQRLDEIKARCADAIASGDHGGWYDTLDLLAEVERLQNNPVMLTMLREARERVADLEADAQRLNGLIQLLIGPRLRDIPASVLDLINKELGT